MGTVTAEIVALAESKPLPSYERLFRVYGGKGALHSFKFNNSGMYNGCLKDAWMEHDECLVG